MRCPQCGTESTPQAAFCSRCGAKLLEVKPASVREYSIAMIRRSYWYYMGQIMVGAILTCVGATLLLKGMQPMQLGFALLIIGIARMTGISGPVSDAAQTVAAPEIGLAKSAGKTVKSAVQKRPYRK